PASCESCAFPYEQSASLLPPNCNFFGTSRPPTAPLCRAKVRDEQLERAQPRKALPRNRHHPVKTCVLAGTNFTATHFMAATADTPGRSCKGDPRAMCTLLGLNQPGDIFHVIDSQAPFAVIGSEQNRSSRISCGREPKE